ncbi:hypothetical protein B0H21DRAFT_716330 [Amylocystis lapponica]|nr:hypothetical protein B0H21DRAFT_716330 [Amylocystis lapponica]
MSTLTELSRVASRELSPAHDASDAALPESESGSALPETSTESAIAASVSADKEDTPVLPPRPEEEHEPAVSESPAVPAQAEQENPQVAALRAMFPDFDATVLLSVLESVEFNQDRAVDILLGMSDPEYVSTETPAAPQQPDLDLDEQLARQLALEDQRERQPRASGQSWPRRDQSESLERVPYQARQPHGQHPQPQNGPAGGDFQQEVQETFSRIAESGKRTFSSIVSKAKAKYTEYQQSRPGQQPGDSTTPQWGGAPPNNADRHSTQEAYQHGYYAYEPNYANTSREQVPATVSSKARPVQGYDLDSHSGGSGPAPSTPSPTSAARSVSPSTVPTRSPMASPRPSGDTPPPPPTLSGGSAAKLGLLPKRPVSLLSSQPPPPNDEDELEYVENPFEEGH